MLEIYPSKSQGQHRFQTDHIFQPQAKEPRAISLPDLLSFRQCFSNPEVHTYNPQQTKVPNFLVKMRVLVQLIWRRAIDSAFQETHFE